MTETERLIAMLKSLLKKRGFTYRLIGKELGLSEQTVKRMFSKEVFTLGRLVRLASLLGMSLAELTDQASHATPSIRSLTVAQEKDLVAEPTLLLVAVCVLNNWLPAEITGNYKLTKAECVKHLLKLDRLSLITLLPGDRVRLNVARDFEWLPNGPIQHFFRKKEKDDFLTSNFAEPGENLYFIFGLLTPPAKLRLQVQLKKLRDEFAELHRESMSAPFDQRSSACLMVAQRKWEPKRFADMRRK